MTDVWLPACAHCGKPVGSHERASSLVKREPSNAFHRRFMSSAVVHARCKGAFEVVRDIAEELGGD